jgi:glycosyltransferase involved in cell wall biosynthesis
MSNSAAEAARAEGGIPMTVKVSVIIPVYNPGKYIDPAIDSLLRQTLPANEFEVLFVDDGSTDDTPERLDQLAKEHPHFRAIHIPNSGWPGKPRNVGVDEARGEYVQFLDQDDYLATDALRRLYEMGHRNGSDIVMGKVASNFRGVPHGVFKADREKVDLRTFPLYDSLTPHKMFRTAFLRENKIAYPEGKRRLEDQLYMMEAYFPAKTVSILGSYTCYYYSKRDDGKNAGSAKLVPAGYYGNLREVLDVVVANTDPGEFRDKLLRRFYRVEMLGRISEPAILRYEDAYRDEMIDEIQKLERDFVTEGVHEGLGALQRMRSTLLRANDREGLLRIARFAASVKATARLEEAEWTGNGRLRVALSAQLVHGEDQVPFDLVEQGGRHYLAPELTSEILGSDEPVDVTDELDGFAAELSLRNRETAVEWSCPATFAVELDDLGEGRKRVVLRGGGHLPTEAVKGRGKLGKGMWDVWAPVRGLGVVKKARIGADRDPAVDAACFPAVLGSPTRRVIPYFTDPYGNLTLDVSRGARELAPVMEGRPVQLASEQPAELRLEIYTSPKTGVRDTAFALVSAAATEAPEAQAPRAHRFKAQLHPALDRAHLRLPAKVRGVPAGEYDLIALLTSPEKPGVRLAKATVDETGRLAVQGVPKLDPAVVAAVAAKRRKDAVKRAVRAVGGPIARRLPAPAKKRLRKLAARL